jgi:hypothetical protein
VGENFPIKIFFKPIKEDYNIKADAHLASYAMGSRDSFPGGKVAGE